MADNLQGRRDFTQAQTGKGIPAHAPGYAPLVGEWWKPRKWVWNEEHQEWWHAQQIAPFGRYEVGGKMWNDVAPLDPTVPFQKGAFIKAEGSHDRPPVAHVTIRPHQIHHSSGLILATDPSKSYTFGSDLNLFPDEYTRMHWPSDTEGRFRRSPPSTSLTDPAPVPVSNRKTSPTSGRATMDADKAQAVAAWVASDEGQRFLTSQAGGAASSDPTTADPYETGLANLGNQVADLTAVQAWADSEEGRRFLGLPSKAEAGGQTMAPEQRQQFALQVLQGLGAPITAGNMDALLAWMGGEETKATNNPLATTQGIAHPERYGGGGENWIFNDHGVKNYPTFEDGVRATVDTINLSAYRDVLGALMEGTTAQDLEPLVVASPWGTGTFGSSDVADALAGLGVVRGWVDDARDEASQGFAAGENVPTGYRGIEVDGQTYLLYTIDPGFGATVDVAFTYDKTLPYLERISASQWQSMVDDNLVLTGGDTTDLHGLGNRNWDDIIDQFIWEAGLQGTDALGDQTIVETLGLWILRPDMSDVELGNRIAESDWTNARTVAELEWNDLPGAEQRQRILDEAISLATAWGVSTGVNLDMSGFTTVASIQAANPELAQWATDIASGKATEPQAVAQWIIPAAAAIEDSPYNRKLTDETRMQGQQDAITADYRSQVIDMYTRYGITVSSADADDISEALYMNTDTLGDLTERVRDQSAGIYPHKPREVDFQTYAAPFANAYAMTLETTVPSFDDPMLAGHLTNPDAAPNLSAFRKELRSDPRWDTTLNARDQYFRSFDQVGRTMGLG